VIISTEECWKLEERAVEIGWTSSEREGGLRSSLWTGQEAILFGLNNALLNAI